MENLKMIRKVKKVSKQRPQQQYDQNLVSYIDDRQSSDSTTGRRHY